MEVINERAGIMKNAKRAFSRIGWACTVLLVVILAVQIAVLVATEFFPDVAFFKNEIFEKLLNYVPMYAIAMPVAALMMFGMKKDMPERNRLSAKKFFLFAIIAWFFMEAGSIISGIVGSVIDGITQTNSGDLLNEAISDMSLVESFFALCIAAPLGEELIFRKVIVDRAKVFGEWPAIFASAFLFALFHTNIDQFVYAFLLGGLFAYVYLRYGNIWHTVLIHAMVNFVGGMIPTLIDYIGKGGGETGIVLPDRAGEPLEIAGGFDFKAIGIDNIFTVIYAAVAMGLAVVGLILFIKNIRNVRLMHGEGDLVKGEYAKAILRNPGMIIHMIVAIFITVVIYVLMM